MATRTLDAASLVEANSTQLLDDALIRICDLMQLSNTQYTLAEQHYHAICDWLSAPESILSDYDPDLYPQGSVALGTTVKPQRSEEYDVDLVCELAIDHSKVSRPVDLLDAIEARMRDSELYKSRLERKKRCLRVNYEHDFHLDILPACPDQEAGGTRLVIPDRSEQGWRASDPKGFVRWFESMGALRFRADRRHLVMDSTAPLPHPESADEKNTLQLTVQLAKRWRDLHYISNPDLAPVSIVLTTLLGERYTGEQSVSTNLVDSIDAILGSIPYGEKLVVVNPSHPDEILSERWEDDNVYEAFVEGMETLRGQLQQLLQANGIGERSALLQMMFGESLAKTAFEQQASLMQEFRESQKMKVAKKASGVVTLAASAGSPVPRNTFYGDAEP